MEEMTALEMQRFLNQQYAEGKTELEAYRNPANRKPSRTESPGARNRPAFIFLGLDITCQNVLL